MKKLLSVIALLFLCYIAFSIAAVVAILACPVALATKRVRYASRVLHAMDCLMAAVMGFDGKSTVSHECGLERTGLCKTICAVLDFLDPGHCAREAQ